MSENYFDQIIKEKALEAEVSPSNNLWEKLESQRGKTSSTGSKTPYFIGAGIIGVAVVALLLANPFANSKKLSNDTPKEKIEHKIEVTTDKVTPTDSKEKVEVTTPTVEKITPEAIKPMYRPIMKVQGGRKVKAGTEVSTDGGKTWKKVKK